MAVLMLHGLFIIILLLNIINAENFTTATNGQKAHITTVTVGQKSPGNMHIFLSSNGTTEQVVNCCVRSLVNEIISIENSLDDSSEIKFYGKDGKTDLAENSTTEFQHIVFMEVNVSSGASLSITGTGNFSWRCGTEVRKTECLNTIMNETMTTTETSKTHGNTTKPMPWKHFEIHPKYLMVIVIALSAFVVVLFLSLVVMAIVLKRKTRHMASCGKCGIKREKSYLEYVTVSNTGGIELRNITSQNQDLDYVTVSNTNAKQSINRGDQSQQVNSSQSNPSSNLVDENDKDENLVNTGNMETSTENHGINENTSNKKKRKSYGPKFIRCSIFNGKIKAKSKNTFVNQTYADSMSQSTDILCDKGESPSMTDNDNNGDVHQMSTLCVRNKGKINQKILPNRACTETNREVLQGCNAENPCGKEDVNSNKCIIGKDMTEPSDTEIQICDENRADTEKLYTDEHSNINQENVCVGNKQKRKKYDHRESVQVICGKNNPVIFLRPKAHNLNK